MWSGRPRFPYAGRARYLLTDLRLVCVEGDRIAEVALYDISDVRVTESRIDRWLHTSTIAVHSRRPGPPLLLHGVGRGTHVAALLELLSGETRATLDVDAVNSALTACR